MLGRLDLFEFFVVEVDVFVPQVPEDGDHVLEVRDDAIPLRDDRGTHDVIVGRGTVLLDPCLERAEFVELLVEGVLCTLLPGPVFLCAQTSTSFVGALLVSELGLDALDLEGDLLTPLFGVN